MYNSCHFAFLQEICSVLVAWSLRGLGLTQQCSVLVVHICYSHACHLVHLVIGRIEIPYSHVHGPYFTRVWDSHFAGSHKFTLHTYLYSLKSRCEATTIASIRVTKFTQSDFSRSQMD